MSVESVELRSVGEEIPRPGTPIYHACPVTINTFELYKRLQRCPQQTKTHSRIFRQTMAEEQDNTSSRGLRKLLGELSICDFDGGMTDLSLLFLFLFLLLVRSDIVSFFWNG